MARPIPVFAFVFAAYAITRPLEEEPPSERTGAARLREVDLEAVAVAAPQADHGPLAGVDRASASLTCLVESEG